MSETVSGGSMSRKEQIRKGAFGWGSTFLQAVITVAATFGVHALLDMLCNRVGKLELPPLFVGSWVGFAYLYTLIFLVFVVLKLLFRPEFLTFGEVGSRRWYLSSRMGMSVTRLASEKVWISLYAGLRCYWIGYLLSCAVSAVLGFPFVINYLITMLCIGSVMTLTLFLLTFCIAAFFPDELISTVSLAASLAATVALAALFGFFGIGDGAEFLLNLGRMISLRGLTWMVISAALCVTALCVAVHRASVQALIYGEDQRARERDKERLQVLEQERAKRAAAGKAEAERAAAASQQDPPAPVAAAPAAPVKRIFRREDLLTRAAAPAPAAAPVPMPGPDVTVREPEVQPAAPTFTPIAEFLNPRQMPETPVDPPAPKKRGRKPKVRPEEIPIPEIPAFEMTPAPEPELPTAPPPMIYRRNTESASPVTPVLPTENRPVAAASAETAQPVRRKRVYSRTELEQFARQTAFEAEQQPEAVPETAPEQPVAELPVDLPQTGRSEPFRVTIPLEESEAAAVPETVKTATLPQQKKKEKKSCTGLNIGIAAFSVLLLLFLFLIVASFTKEGAIGGLLNGLLSLIFGEKQLAFFWGFLTSFAGRAVCIAAAVLELLIVIVFVLMKRDPEDPYDEFDD